MEDRNWLLVCARCGDRIGVYEPLWLELADGTLHSTSYLNLAKYDLHQEPRLWHLGCLAPDAGPPASDP